jgi:hypothetical protein
MDSGCRLFKRLAYPVVAPVCFPTVTERSLVEASRDSLGH